MTSEQIELIADWRKGKHSSGAYYTDDDHFNPLLATTSYNVGELTMPGFLDMLGGLRSAETTRVGGCRIEFASNPLHDDEWQALLILAGDIQHGGTGENAIEAFVAVVAEWRKRAIDA